MIVYNPVPVLFELGSLKVYSYGVMVALAFFVCLMLVRKKAGKGLKQHVDYIFFLALLGGIIGARLGWIFMNLNQIISLADIFRIWEGGMASYGGIAGALIPAFIYIKRQKLNFPELADLFAPYAALGFAIGRIGCFLRWCCYGKPTMFSLALWVNGIPRHATQLYLVAGNLLIFGVLFIAYKRLYDKKRKDIKNSWVKKIKSRFAGFLDSFLITGSIFFLFLLLYSALGFFVDFLRAYQPHEYIAGLAISQWISMLLLSLSLFCIIIRKK